MQQPSNWSVATKAMMAAKSGPQQCCADWARVVAQTPDRLIYRCPMCDRMFDQRTTRDVKAAA